MGRASGGNRHRGFLLGGGYMKDSEVYLRAAQLLDAEPAGAHSGACSALIMALRYSPPCLTDKPCHACMMLEYFHSGHDNGYWLGGLPSPSGKNTRVLALLLMSAIAESEGR